MPRVALTANLLGLFACSPGCHSIDPRFTLLINRVFALAGSVHRSRRLVRERFLGLCFGLTCSAGGCGFLPVASILSSTQRRKARRLRATARRVVWLYKKGWVFASKARLLHCRKILSQHHSADPVFLRSIQRAAMEDYQQRGKPAPWKCGPCKRMVKGRESYCPACYGHWSVVQTTESGGWNWDKWQSASQQPKNPKVPKPRRPSRSQSAHAGKESNAQGSGEGLPEIPGFPPAFKQTGPSPFSLPATSYSGANAAFSPWNVQERPPERPSEAAGVNSELLTALRKAFPKQEDMPEELREVMNRTHANVGKQLTVELHRAAAMLGKARKSWAQIQESQRVHKARWMQHVAESIDSWRAQIQAYKVQQDNYQTSLSQAQKEIEAARATIQRLNQEAAGALCMPKEVSDMMEASPSIQPPDQNDLKMRAMMQAQLQEAFEAMTDAPSQQDSMLDDRKTAQPQSKRHRSASPSASQDREQTEPAPPVPQPEAVAPQEVRKDAS